MSTSSQEADGRAVGAKRRSGARGPLAGQEGEDARCVGPEPAFDWITDEGRDKCADNPCLIARLRWREGARVFGVIAAYLLLLGSLDRRVCAPIPGDARVT